jgi:putative Mg2+ transporter-C (MgtC) family protein
MIAPDAVPTWSEAVIRLLAATGIGGAIGLNRELTRKPAGLRTHALVALGSALVTVTGLQLGMGGNGTNADATSRVIQGVIAGIGFLGGGVILHTDGRNVLGLTTAATIWVSAALGISCGVGQWRIAGIAVAIALVVLVVGRGVESGLHRLQGKRGETGNRERGPGTEHQ